MLDRGTFWTPAAAAGEARFSAPGLSVTPVPGLVLTLVSAADLRRATAKAGLSAPLGVHGVAHGRDYVLAAAYDRWLVVSGAPSSFAEGYDSATGLAATVLSDAFVVVDIEGPRVADLVARATTLEGDSPSAAIVFGGLPCLACRHERADRLRLHVEHPFAATLARVLDGD